MRQTILDNLTFSGVSSINMHQKIKAEIQIFSVLLLATIALILLSLFIGNNAYPPRAAAQGPLGTPPPPSLSTETLTALGLSAEDILQTQAFTYNLAINIAPGTLAVNDGNAITYTITITNNGPDPAAFVLLNTSTPAEMTNVNYEFSATTVISDSQTQPTWVLQNELTSGATTVITVTGTASAACDANESATAYIHNGGTNATDDSDSISLNITGAATCALYTYLPLIYRYPTPTPNPIVLAYHEDFSDGDAWYEYDNDGCKTENRDGRYWVEADQDDRNCLPPAKNEDNPEKPYRKTGEFEVKAYHSEDLSASGRSNAAYGLFINGNGGAEYYYFLIWPNNSCSSGGDWRLVRRYNNNESTIKSGSCNTSIYRGGSTNTLRIAHKSDGTLIVYANGTELGRYTDSSDLDGTGTGVYARSDDEDSRIKFDDFKVYKYP